MAEDHLHGLHRRVIEATRIWPNHAARRLMGAAGADFLRSFHLRHLLDLGRLSRELLLFEALSLTVLLPGALRRIASQSVWHWSGHPDSRGERRPAVRLYLRLPLAASSGGRFFGSIFKGAPLPQNLQLCELPEPASPALGLDEFMFRHVQRCLRTALFHGHLDRFENCVMKGLMRDALKRESAVQERRTLQRCNGSTL